MIIPINKEYRVTTDSMNWKLQYRMPGSTAKDGGWKTVGFFRNVWLLCRELAHRRIMELPGTYPPEALEESMRLLAQIEDETKLLEEKFGQLLPENFHKEAA